MKRGFGDNRDGSILRDGFRMALPSNFSATTDRVEVLKGPSSMLYGVLDPGGVVNIITKKPELQQRGTVSVNGTSFNGGGATLDVTGPIQNGFAYRFIGDYQDTDYWRNPRHRHRYAHRQAGQRPARTPAGRTLQHHPRQHRPGLGEHRTRPERVVEDSHRWPL